MVRTLGQAVWAPIPTFFLAGSEDLGELLRSAREGDEPTSKLPLLENFFCSPSSCPRVRLFVKDVPTFVAHVIYLAKAGELNLPLAPAIAFPLPSASCEHSSRSSLSLFFPRVRPLPRHCWVSSHLPSRKTQKLLLISLAVHSLQVDGRSSPPLPRRAHHPHLGRPQGP